MSDLNINIGGPRDQAQQTNTFNIHRTGADETSIPVADVIPLIQELRQWARTESLPEDDARRLERSIETIQDESQSERPQWDEIERSLSRAGKIITSVTGVSSAVIESFKRLAALLGFGT